MTEPMRSRHARQAWNRVVAALVILSTLLSPALAGPRPARAAPAAQAQYLCKLVPPGYDPTSVTDMEDYCHVIYNEADGSIVFFELSRAYSPADVHDLMVSCHPSDCASGGACEGRPCQILDWGDAAPAGRDKGLRGVVYDPTTSQEGGLAYAFTRGCYLLKGSTLDTTDDSKAYLWNRMLQADALVGTDPCAGCEDLAACQGMGTGGTGTSGTGAAGTGTSGTIPGGTFAVSRVSCRYDASVDAANCEAEVVNARPDATLEYDWALDGVPKGTIPGPQTLFAIGCAGEHTVSVIVRDTKNTLSSTAMSTKITSTYGAPCTAGTGTGSIQVQTASGTTRIGGSSGSWRTSLELSPEEEAAAKIYADCPELAWMLLTDLRFDGNLAVVTSPGESSRAATYIVLAMLILDCGRLHQKAEGPLQIAAVGDPALFLPAQAAGDDLPVQLWIGHEGGPLRVTANSDQVLLQVQTSVATVRSAGQNDFGVNYDADTGETTVAAYGGSVEVYSSNTGEQIAALGAGQQVAVPAAGASTTGSGEAGTGPSVVGPYGEGSGQPQGSAAPASRVSSNMAALIGVPLAVILLCVAVVVLRRRGRAAGGRPGMAAAPAQATPGPRGQGRLVVLQGPAKPPSLPLAGSMVVLGSDRSCALVLSDPLVSPQHASLAWYGGAWVLSDASTNGTFVNGVRVTRQELRPGDVIQIGSVRLAFQVEA